MLKIALAQLNFRMGDLEQNHRLIQASVERAERAGADLVIFSECALSGYLPGDLLRHKSFRQKQLDYLEAIAELSTEALGILVGFVGSAGGEAAEDLYNQAALCRGGEVVKTVRKSLLARGGYFDEARYFRPAEDAALVEFKGAKLGVLIGEEEILRPGGLSQDLARAGADMLVYMAASAFYSGKPSLREAQLSQLAQTSARPVIFINHIGGQDELVYDGGSLIAQASGDISTRLTRFEEDFRVEEVSIDRDTIDKTIEAGVQTTLYIPRSAPPLPASPQDLLAELLKDPRELRRALVLGLRDYAKKSGLKRAILGLSGGIDSALCAAIAAEALGPTNILGVAMPTRYTSEISNVDARQLADTLGCEFMSLAIDSTFEAFLAQFESTFSGREPDITEENLQARIRGASLMALSNKFGGFVLVPGNKSEIAMGYTTLYGDMVGAISPLGDCFKTQVWAIARDINAEAAREIIPTRTIERPPSAELKPDQVDEDSLPPYDKLDAVLAGFLHHQLSSADLIQLGYDPRLVERVIASLFRAEFKRRQAAPIIQVSPGAFGPSRRYPLAAKFDSLI